MRRILIALLLFSVAAPAQAAPLPLTSIDGASEIALAGDQALYTRLRGRVLSVFAVPVTGGTPRRVFSYTTRSGVETEALLSASAQRAAIAIAQLRDGDDGNVTVQGFSVGGPLTAPWTPLAPPAKAFRDTVPAGVQVDGDRLFTIEIRGALGNFGVTVRDPEPHDVPFSSPVEAATAIFAGDLVAYSTKVPGDEGSDDDYGGRRLIVRNWRTGEQRSVTDFESSVEPKALRGDGRVVSESVSAVYVSAPGVAPRRIKQFSSDPRFAGEQIVFRSFDGLRAVAADGRVRRFGMPSEDTPAIVTDDRHVLWIANDCLLVADATDTSVGALGPGPCPRSEIALSSQLQVALAPTIRVQVRCVSAPKRCRGTVRFPGFSRPARYAITAGSTARVRVPLTAARYRSLQRRVAREADFTLKVDVRDDGGDRVVSALFPLAQR